jgi:small subunit ribosomal protein S2
VSSNSPNSTNQAPTNPLPSLRCIQVIAGVLGRAGEAGQKQRLAAARKGNVTYRPAQGLQLPDADEAAEATAASTGSSSLADRETLGDSTEMAGKLEDVRDHASHRTKEGRAIKVSA